MAVFHIKVDKILKGKPQGGGAGFARYIAREAQGKATQMAWYMVRESHHAKDDLVTKDHGNVPPWAQGDPSRFWAAGDRYETKGWLIARTYEIALPRELSGEHREALVRDICQTFFAQHVHAWAIHNPKAHDGKEQPHVHLMVNERILDGIERPPQQFFRRAANVGKDLASGGARKDHSWNHRDRLAEFRAGVALLTNAALQRAGHTVVVDPRPIKDRGYRYDREPEREQTQRERYRTIAKGEMTPQWQQTLQDRARLHRDFYPYEQWKARQFWTVQKQREGLPSVAREAVVAHVQQRFWGHGQARESMQTRAMDAWRTIEQELQRRGPLSRLVPPHALRQERDHPEPPQKRRSLTLSRGRAVDDVAHQGAHVHLREHADEQELTR